MKTINSKFELKLKAFIFILPAMLLMSFNNPPANDLVIIVNQTNPISTVTPAEAKEIYLRKTSKRWKAINQNVIPLDKRGDSESKQLFLKQVLKMSNIEMYKYFSEREYQNQESAPVRVSSDEDVVAFVEQNPGAIGYVMSNVIAEHKNVKVICTIVQ